MTVTVVLVLQPFVFFYAFLNRMICTSVQLIQKFASKLLNDLKVVYNQEDEGAIYVRGEAVYHKSTAILQALSDCCWPISMAKIFLYLPQGLRNSFYRAFAKRRLKNFQAAQSQVRIAKERRF